MSRSTRAHLIIAFFALIIAVLAWHGALNANDTPSAGGGKPRTSTEVLPVSASIAAGTHLTHR